MNAAGDINNDGVDELIIGASGVGWSDNFIPGHRASYVVFSGSSVGVIELSDLDGTNGFVLNGLNQGRYSAGLDVSGAGDINDDGVNDIIIGARDEQTFGSAGASFVVFGRASTPAPMLTCNGLTVTVNLALGQVPTSGDDVILATERADTIRALGGNDTICGLGGRSTRVVAMTGLMLVRAMTECSVSAVRTCCMVVQARIGYTAVLVTI